MDSKFSWHWYSKYQICLIYFSLIKGLFGVLFCYVTTKLDKVNTGMTTPWTFPTLVEQYAEDESHIGWSDVDDFAALKSNINSGVVAVAPLFHIARSPKYDIKMKTWYLRCTGFDFVNLPDTVSGIALRLGMHRGGRVTDETINLCYQTTNIGKNKAQLILDPTVLYGGSTDTWESENISIETVQDSSFGIVLRFQSHPHWPHKTVPIVNAVELQIS